MLDNIPDGAPCFVDANVIAYYLLNVAPFAQRCEGFFKRVENRVLLASTSAAVIAEATHKVMLAEAIEQHGLGHQGLAHRLQRRRDLIATLSKHRKVVEFVRAVSVHIEPVTLEICERAAAHSVHHRLLTNDAITVATMEKLGLTDLVTNDDNFDSVTKFTIWKPR